jgi:nicotinamidase/pyrazinamidase
MKAFFDIDTQLDFLYPAGALYTPGCGRVIPAVAKLNAYAAANRIPLISTTCAHTEAPQEFKVWPPHCVKGCLGQRKPAATLTGEGQIILEKNELDLFSNPETDRILQRLAITECIVYGVLTEYCVRLACMGLLSRGLHVTLVRDAIAHLSAGAARQMEDAFIAATGEIVTLKEIIG